MENTFEHKYKYICICISNVEYTYLCTRKQTRK